MSKELLFSVTMKDFDISYFSGTGAGGQHRNKHANSVHLKHRDSGVMTSAQNSRSKEDNLRQAFLTLTANPQFKAWHKVKCAEMLQTAEDKARAKQEADEWVSKQLSPEKLRVEVKDENNQWIEDITKGENDEIGFVAYVRKI